MNTYLIMARERSGELIHVWNGIDL